MTTGTDSLPKKALHKENPQRNRAHAFMKQHGELIAALLSGAIILITWACTAIIPHSVWIILHLFAFFIGGYAQAKEGILSTIKEKELNVELLMVIAAIGAAVIGYWTEGAILIFIFALAGALETYTLQKSEQEVSSLMSMQPEVACVVRDGMEGIIPVKELQIGDEVLVRASERIPADGHIIKGSSTIDESAITGESIPVLKQQSHDVFAGTVALDGTITLSLTKPVHETVFQKIIDMIQSARDEKPPTQLFIEKFEGTYVKVVLITVLILMFLPYLFLGWTLTESIYRAMILLVVASPCALVASIMPATLSAISKSAKGGVLFKGGVHAEMIGQINTMAFDKTGTLTHGTPVVTDVIIHPERDANQIHQAVGAIENESTHPLARAITAHSLNVLQKNQFDVHVQKMKTMSGRGVIGTIQDEKWYIGKENLTEVDEHPFKQEAAELGGQGKTIVYVAHNKCIIALYALKDTIRKDAIKTIDLLHKKGIKTIMLTGDHEGTAKVIAGELKMDYVAECLPDEKVDYVKKLIDQHGKVAMIGDGINDAPALATAHIGIAIGEGTDVALETADMVLMKNDLTAILNALTLSKRMNRIIKQNIVFSLSVIGLLILSNFLQVIDMPLGVIGHEGSTILVILNGLRLLK